MPDPETPEASDRIVELVYERLRQVAERAMTGERRDHTLQPTALVHEVWLRLAEDMARDGWDRERFVAHAARTARRALVDHARRKGSARRGGGAQRVTLDSLLNEDDAADPIDMLVLDEALQALAACSERQARVVELRWFGGLSFAEIGHELDVSDRTAKGDWRVARAWLARYLEEECG